ncbi:MAG: hypothetical protein Kow0092_00300 [Deferrisomatales bacterium]
MAALWAAGSPAAAMQLQEARGVPAVLAALAGRGSGAASPLKPAPAGPTLVIVDLAPGDAQGELEVGMGDAWRTETGLRHFLGLGAAFTAPRPADPPADRLGEDSSAPRVPSLRAWVGAGTLWEAGERASLGVTFSWEPLSVAPGPPAPTPAHVEALGTFRLRW